LTEYIDSWRLVSTTEEKFDKALTYLNLTEYKDYKDKDRIDLNLVLESPLKGISNGNVDIQATVASKKTL
jgi:hypothetical protein